MGQLAGCYRFNIRTKHRARLRFAPSDDVLFLKEDVMIADMLLARGKFYVGRRRERRLPVVVAPEVVLQPDRHARSVIVHFCEESGF